MAARAEAESLLVEAAASHGIGLSPHEIRAALSDGQSGADLATWATTNLVGDNLLTVDELALYNALDKSGQVDRLAELHDLADVPSLREDDVRAAVDELRQSADAMRKQAETLRYQRDALARLVANRADAQARRRELEAARHRQSQSERITEIAHGLEFRISELKQDNDPKATSLEQALDVILQSDDALLTSLQKLGWELSEPDPEEAKSTDKLRETCLRLIKITVETIRTRLDTTYLSALATAQQQNSRDHGADPDEMDALQAELESLYAEILPVAQMSVEQQHLEPALQSIAARSGQSLRKTASSLTYMDQCLDYLLSRVNALHSHTELYNAHHAAVSRVVATAREEMASEVPGPEPTPSMDAAASPIKPPTRSKRLSRDMTHHRRRSSGIQETPALDSLMQSLALPLDAYGDGSSTSQIAALSRILRERRQKDAAAARSAQDEFETAATERLDDARRAIQLLRDSVLAESSFGDLSSLADPGIEQSIDVLGQEVDKARDKLDRFESEKVGWGSLKRDEFIERWAR